MITLRGLEKHYGKTSALSQVDLTIRDGEFLAILGPSGCGKTTLLRLLAGFMKPTAGSIQFGETEVANSKYCSKPENRNIGMVFQSFALWPHMTVEEHIRFSLKNHRFAKKRTAAEQADRVTEVLRLVGMESFRKRYPTALSGGQQQRVALARAIAPEPDILLMDEPLSALDAELRISMRKEIKQIHKKLAATIIYVTHDQGEALAMADRVLVMQHGQIEQTAAPEEIYQHPKTPFVATFVGKANLVAGTWEENHFIPAGSHYRWQDNGVSEQLKQQQFYPVRPEEWQLLPPDAEGLKGEVIISQFQGTERHYVIRVDGQEYQASLPISVPAWREGDLLTLQVKGMETAVSREKILFR
ncbi:iron(III) transport system ATP-binding protein [Terribacillus halophilus]|uniref:Iron(III) transport system ATP-binding protein n=1 Tax=Terribacillus halophilus TaxID=361279 RepID=A0A1G6PSV1_9BACI|nr:ABC transporter ATP-binding protein [Terribacillus halophilus]SDC83213.1 iron(III) transport system ATP-binding protein [Terribacillus halophilus]